MSNRDVRAQNQRDAVARAIRPGHTGPGPCEPLGLTARLRDDLGRTRNDRPEIAERSVVGMLLELAVRGNPRGVQEIWTRIEGRPGDRPEPPPFQIDEETARKLLEFGVYDDDLQGG